jgi:hypothetical protein
VKQYARRKIKTGPAKEERRRAKRPLSEGSGSTTERFSELSPDCHQAGGCGARMKLYGVHWDGRRWRVILRIEGKSKHVGYFGLLWGALICANYHIAYLGLNMPLNDIAELSKTHPVLIAERPKRKRDLLRKVPN